MSIVISSIMVSSAAVISTEGTVFWALALIDRSLQI